MRRFCSRCGRRLEKDSLRYVVRIQVSAAYDPLKITKRDILKDHTEEIERLVRQCEGMTKSELMRDVYAKFKFDLCRPCQKVYVADPLPPAPRVE